MKKFMTLCMAIGFLLAASTSLAHAAYACPHTVKVWAGDTEKIIQRVEGHEIIISEIYRCTQCNMQVEVIISKSLVGHDFDLIDSDHLDEKNQHMYVYRCSACYYEAYRYEPCYGPPCATPWID